MDVNPVLDFKNINLDEILKSSTIFISDEYYTSYLDHKY
jgi:hypothetical protein